MALAARELTESGFVAFATWLTIANLVGLAFVVVEVYLPRLLVATRGSGSDVRALVASFSRGVLLAASLLAAVVILTAPWTLSRLFADDPALLGLVVVYLFAMSLQSLQRGVAIGRDRFEVFTVQMGTDGAVRLAGCTLATLAGAGSPTAYAGVLCVAAAFGVAAGTLVNGQWFAWNRPLARVAVAPIGLLFSASIGPLVMNNAGVPWLAATADVTPRSIGAVAGALTLSRLPTLMVSSAYGPVLEPLARAVEDGRHVDFRKIHRTAAVAALLLAGLFAAVFALAGPRLLQFYLGPSFQLSRAVMAAMGAGSGLMFASVVEQAALVALSAWHRVAVGWLAGLMAFVCVLFLPLDAVVRVSLAVLAGPLTAIVVMAAGRLLVERPVFARNRAA
jgi:O-antigen/teichoic acid export membrane protein